MSDYEKLTDREIDALVAERVMGKLRPAVSAAPETETNYPWIVTLSDDGKWIWYCATKYSQNDNAARLVRDRIAELGRVPQYRHYLAKQIWPADTPFDQFKGADEFAFRFEQATPRQQCIAALQALESQQAGSLEK